MHLSLGQAAKETGMDKSTISRAIKSGKLSATRQEHGGYAIDPAEAHEPPVPYGTPVHHVDITGKSTNPTAVSR